MMSDKGQLMFGRSKEQLKLLPITEQSNPITKDIDVASVQDIVRLLHEADKQIFSYRTGKMGILEGGIELNLEKLLIMVCDILKMNSDECAIVLSGCGTSGRLAFITARTFNRRLLQVGREPMFHYLIAGEDEALLRSKELTEDDPISGIMDLEKLTKNHRRVLYFGITCGLSAPYVAGQLDYCLKNLDRFIPILVGFNPIECARDVSIENWDKTFLQVVKLMSDSEKEGNAFIINPIIGEEPITGSTRMKCGTSTKILLESIFSCAMLKIIDCSECCTVKKLMMSYKVVENVAFEQVESLASLISIGGQCLNSGGHIYYLSNTELGIIGMIDASECVPTFGADINDVRGFVIGGFIMMGNKQGDLSHVMKISVEYFEAEVIASLTANDLIIFISENYDTDWIGCKILDCIAKKALLCFSDSVPTVNFKDTIGCCFTLIHCVIVPRALFSSLCDDQTFKFCSSLFNEIACKWTCNIISTGAHILKGKVYENFMIDVKVSNNKLFHRAVSLVQKFGECSRNDAYSALLRSIYNTNSLTATQENMPVSEHIKTATNGQKVVSSAIILTRHKCLVEEAKKLLTDHPVTRNALAYCLGH